LKNGRRSPAGIPGLFDNLITPSSDEKSLLIRGFYSSDRENMVIVTWDAIQYTPFHDLSGKRIYDHWH
jgi:hypothetical protein